MFKTLLTFVVTFGGIMTAGAAFSEDIPVTTAPPSASVDAPTEATTAPPNEGVDTPMEYTTHEQFQASLNAQLEAATQSIIDTNMKDPQIQKAYQSYLQAGGLLDLRAYCLRYAETGGFNPVYDQKEKEAKLDDIELFMKNPRVHKKYEDYLEQGGSMEFRGFCIRYAGTSGFLDITYQEYLRDFRKDYYRQDKPMSEFEFYKWLASVQTQQVSRIPNGTYLYRDTDGQFWMHQNNQWISVQLTE